MIRRLGIVVILGLFLLLMAAPLVQVISVASSKGWEFYQDTLRDSNALSAIKLSGLVALICVPTNLIFGLLAGWSITKFDFLGKSFLLSLIDLPFSISPVVSGLMYMLVFGLGGWLYPILHTHYIDVIFAVPGIVLVTIFVTFPLIAREIIPLMEGQGRAEEEAAALLGAGALRIMLTITLPNIKWALLSGILLCTARALGEFGAVSVISGHIIGRTNTIPLYVETLYNDYNITGAFVMASLLSGFGLITMVLKTIFETKQRTIS